MTGLPVATLSAQGLSKAFPGVRALDEVSLELRPGRLVALLGENGAGKSTLMSILAGVMKPDRGELFVDGQPVRFSSVRDARAHGIAAIFQELSLATNLTVAENIFLGREPRTSVGLIDYDAMNARARALLSRLGLDVPPQTPVETLRVGQQQVVEIARSLAAQARVLIMDEPTSALAQTEIVALLRLIDELKRAGVAIAYITHKFEELTGIADEVVIMRDGRIVAQRAFGDISHGEIVRLMVGRDMRKIDSRPSGKAGEEVLRVDGICLPHATRGGDFVVKDVSLQVGRGEVVGLFGLVGAGRTELLEAIFGSHGRRAQGQVFVGGKQVQRRTSAAAIAAGLALAPEDRKQGGLVLGMGSRENAGLASARASTRWGFLSPRREALRVKPLLEQLHLKAGSLDEPVLNLSGGNQQKVVLAKWLATHPRVLLLDEPTRGIDVNAKNEIYGLIHDLAARGLGVLMASSEIPEVLAVCDRVIVLCEGRTTAEFDRSRATPELLIQAALPRASSGLRT